MQGVGMDWHHFLREEGARKLAAIDARSSGAAVLLVRTDSEFRDVSAKMITEHGWHIAEMEEILTAAGKPLDF
jgi:hypothetical protein